MTSIEFKANPFNPNFRNVGKELDISPSEQLVSDMRKEEADERRLAKKDLNRRETEEKLKSINVGDKYQGPDGENYIVFKIHKSLPVVYLKLEGKENGKLIEVGVGSEIFKNPIEE